MHQLSKFSFGLLRPLSSPGGLLAPCGLRTTPVIVVQNFSDGPHFITEGLQHKIKMGRGGRSSFNGVVATIFGSSGFTGHVVCNRLAKIGTQLILPYRCDPYYIRSIKVVGDLGQVLFQPFDDLDEEVIRKAIKHSDIVINLLGRDYATRNYSFDKINVEIPTRVAKVCQEMGTPKLIHISALNCETVSKGTFKRGGSKFLKTKLIGEKAVKEAFPKVVILRPSQIWGNEDRFFRAYLDMSRKLFTLQPLPNSGKDIWKQPVFLGDFAHAITTIAMDPDISGKTYDIIGPRRYEYCDLIKWMNMWVGKDVTISNANYDPTMHLRAYLQEHYHLGSPYGNLTLDTLERESLTDTPTGFPRLTDLGITPMTLEERIEWEVWPINKTHMDRELGIREKPTPPKYIEDSCFV